MLTRSRLLLVLSILFAPDVTRAQTSFDAAQLAVELTRVQKENLQILRMYEWRTGTEVVLSDQSKAVQLEKVSFTEDGERRRKLIGASSLGKNPRAKTLLPKIRGLAARYTEPSVGALVDFFAKAKFTPGKGAMAGTVKVIGKSFLETGDIVGVWFDLEAMRPRKYKFLCQLDGSRVQGDVDFKAHPEGFFYIEQIVVKIPDKDILTTIRNYDFVNRMPPEQLKSDLDSDEEGWPREYAGGDAKLVIYQPQIDSWKNYRKLGATTAFSVEWDGKEPVFGVIHIAARTETNFSSRTVLIMDHTIEQLHWSDLEETQQKKAESTLRSLLPKKPIPHSLDRILAEIGEDDTRQKNAELSFDPPQILVSESPAVLLMVFGEPFLEEIAGTDLKQVLNTDWDLFWHESSSQYYLGVENSWLQAPALDGSWALCPKLPKSFQEIPAEPRWESLQKKLKRAPRKSSEATPKIYHSSEAAELIVIGGEPLFEPIANTRLLEVINTDSDLFFHLGDSEYYFLVAGRWFRSGTLEGPWSFANHDLPKDFSKISPEHGRAGVLASVPGTPAAQEARILAQIPRTASVERHSPEVEVTYDGDPEFQEISGTSLQYATNTTFDVIQASDEKTYLCHGGVWFVSDSPTGPWSVCVEVPQEIYDIPSSSPKYHVTYVKVYEYNDDTATVGYTEGYNLLYTSDDYDDGTVYYGTGYYYGYPYGYWRYYNRYGHRYRAWRHHRMHHRTYGRGVVYDAHRVGFSAGRRYSRYHANRARAEFGGNVYSSWGSKGVRANHRVSNRGAGSGGRVVRNSPRNVYAGRDGGVYRKQNGRWQRREGNGWKNVRSPKARTPRASGQETARKAEARKQRDVQKRLDRDARNRKTGSQRVSQRRSSSSRSRGAARSGGGRLGARR